jgi:uncharacterized phage protein gp47/JayE
MATTLELTPEGLLTQTQQEIIEELTAKLRATFGNNLNTSTESIMGQLVNIVSEFRALDQQVLLAVWRSFDPNSAIGVALDRLAALTGSVREGSTVSVVDGILTFSGAGTVNDGDLINNDDNETQWEAVGGPYVSAGPWPEEIDATFNAVLPGPTLANANTNWSLVTAVPGLDSFTNPNDDADPGQLAQTDPQFRETRQIELYSQNIGGLAAIRAVVSKVPGVVTARVYHNPNNPAGIDGIPFKAFNVVVETNPSPPGVQLRQNIANAIFSATGAGGEAFGTDYTETVVDDEGQPHSISFDLVDEVDVFAIIDLETAGTEQAISPNLDTVVAEAVLAFAQANFNGIGQNQLGFEWSAIVSNLQDSGEISGVTGVVIRLSRVGFGGPFFDPLEIDIRERPSFESVNIQVNVIP